jgi:anti-sigma B factor antagonist
VTYADLHLEREPAGAAQLVVASGDLDFATAPRLSVMLGELAREDAGEACVDLSEVTFVDSTGLSALLTAARRFERAHRRLVLVVPPDGPVRRLLEMTQMLDAFEVHEDRAAALGAAAGAA